MMLLIFTIFPFKSTNNDNNKADNNNNNLGIKASCLRPYVVSFVSLTGTMRIRIHLMFKVLYASVFHWQSTFHGQQCKPQKART